MEQMGNEVSILEGAVVAMLIGEHFFYAKVLQMCISSLETAGVAFGVSYQNPEIPIESILEELPCNGLHRCVCDKTEEQKATIEKVNEVFNTLAKKFMDTGREKAEAAWPTWKLDPENTTLDFGDTKCGKCFGCVGSNDKDCLEDAIARHHLWFLRKIAREVRAAEQTRSVLN